MRIPPTNTTFSRVFVGLGGNIGDPVDTFREALRHLSQALGLPVATSSLYETKALTVDGSEQSNYLNAVVEFHSTLPPERLISILLETERHLGRDRSTETRWAPRLIDLDLLFTDAEVRETNDLVLPHPEIHKRDFVLIPFGEIAPDFIHPTLGERIDALALSLDSRGYERFVVGKLSQTL
jgi:2-amino-4-hydroxy-6-hydroxymethyldihydropteridine diphosphokinase